MAALSMATYGKTPAAEIPAGTQITLWWATATELHDAAVTGAAGWASGQYFTVTVDGEQYRAIVISADADAGRRGVTVVLEITGRYES